MKADVKVRNQSQPVSLSEDPAHLTCLGLMAFKSPPIPNQTKPHPPPPAAVCCQTPSRRATGITYLQINPCLIKHIYVSPERSSVGRIWALYLGARDDTALNVVLHPQPPGPPPLRRHVLELTSCRGFAPRDCVFCNRQLPLLLSPGLTSGNKAARELNPLASLRHINIL